MRRLPALLILLASFCLAQPGSKSGIDRSTLDTTCKPCDDFWRYANGAWIDKNPIPAQFASWGTFTVLRDDNLERLKVILEAAASNQKSTGEERLIGDFYTSCMDSGAIEAAGIKPLQPVLQQIADVKSQKDLVAVLVSLELHGELGPARIAGQADRANADSVITAIGANELSLDRDYYLNDDARSKEIRSEFLLFSQHILGLLGDKADAAAAEARTILDFETVFAKARLPRADRRDPAKTYHKMDLAKLQELAPGYDWSAALKAVNIPPTVAINVAEPDYLRTFDQELKQAPVETWKTWLRWRLADDRAEHLTKAFYDEWFHFRQTVLNGVKEQRPRWKVCATQADARFGDALGKLYIDKHFGPEAKRRMSELVVNMRQALHETLNDAAWLEPETRKNAIRKLDSFDPQIGFPSKWKDYSGVRVTRGDYMAGLESAIVENRRMGLAKVGQKTDRTEWGMTAPTVNAQYNSSRNSITFPAGILQPPFFMFDADDAVNYGAIGAVIGHEMGHGFDDQGSKFDAEGNQKNWWTDQDRQKFEARAACVTNQFDSIDLGNGLHHNGKLVTGEAMGDLGGLTLAYKAYHASLKGKAAPVLDGFTGDQRFFLAWARVWASQSRPEAMQVRLTTDPHPLDKYRTNATLQNMPEFQAAFSCKRGDAMVRPVDRQCHLW